MKRVGTIVLLQVQPESVKVGDRRQRLYDPSIIRAVPALRLTREGVVGQPAADEAVIDVHHRDHPESKNRGDNGISIGFTSHYRRMRERFGPHIADGIAGENIVVGGDEDVRATDVMEGVVIVTGDGRQAHLRAMEAAEPCVEFSRHALGLAPDTPTDATVTETLRFLREGMRGYYATLDGEPVVVRPGDGVFLA
ncbi:MAG: hypothetical protein NVSMB22_25300 [Chloroflexota bacterium]